MSGGSPRDSARQALLGVLGRPRSVALDAEIWTAAAVLGGLRQASNDSHRSRRRDRGVAKNSTGDLQGALGELLVAKLVEQELPAASVTFEPLRWEGAGDDVDVQCALHGENFVIETKCHLHESSKRLFLINADAVDRSRARGALSFVPVMSESGAIVAALGRPILIEDVLKWPTKSWSYGDPARSMSLVGVAKKYFGREYEQIVAEVHGAKLAIEAPALTAHARTARERFGALRSDGIAICSRPSDAISQLARLAV